MHQRRGVFSHREFLHFSQGAVQILLKLGFKPLVIARGGRVSRQKQDERKIVARVEIQGKEIEHHRHQHDAVEIHAVPVLQVTCQAGSSCGPVAFADEVAGRSPAMVAGDVEPDEVPDRFDVGFEAVELLVRLSRHGPAKPGCDRIDEHQIRLV